MKHSRSSALSAYREFEMRKEDEQIIQGLPNEENSTQLSDAYQYSNDICSIEIFSELIENIKKSYNIIKSVKENHKYLLRKKMLSLVLSKKTLGVSEKILVRRFSEDKAKKKNIKKIKGSPKKQSIQTSPRASKDPKHFSATLQPKKFTRISKFSIRNA